MSRRLRVLDCFGTVVFSAGGRPDHRKMAHGFEMAFGCTEAIAKTFVYPLVAHAWLPGSASLDVAAHVARFARQISVPEQDILDFLWQAVGPGEQEWTVPPGVHHALDAWRTAGGELRMLTNCALTPRQLDAALAELGLRDYFSVVLASSAGQGKKPEPAWFRTAFEGEFADVAMIGDHPEFDVAPAQALGIPVFRVTGPDVWDAVPDLLRPDVTATSHP